ncbi:phosphatidylinositol 3,4,5-trisphosphate 5-phosphatase 1-like isoform X2 [Amphiura filiformis]|uniref:phosphatidylinositol 3,4,5-trisphosphate 5-phosphatase 1-like isoform X2 n=1 Tax=Amphiura filiformis TaxID=82378 RepID=UPI003B20C412
MTASYPWCHGSISRVETEQLLHQTQTNGSFLVRSSENVKGAFVLSVLHEGRIYQYRILPAPQGNGYIMKSSDPVKQHPFSNLGELINSYKISNNGLCCALKNPVEAQKMEEEQESDDDDDDEDKLSMTDTSSTLSENSTFQVLQSRMEALNLSALEDDFIEELRQYFTSKVRADFEAVKVGGSDAPELKQLLMSCTKDLARHVDMFLLKVEVLRQIFDLRSSSNHLSIQQKKTDGDLNNFFNRLGECQTSVMALQNKATATLLDLSKTTMLTTQSTGEEGLGESDDDDDRDHPNEQAVYMPAPDGDMDIETGETDGLNKSCSLPMLSIQPTAFEVKVEGLTVDALKNTKVKLTVDVPHGHLTVKKNVGTKEEMTTLTHDKIVQLVKSRGNNMKLQIRLNNGKKKEYGFEDVKKRETFCQMIQYMKKIHSNSKEVDQISIFIGTWNMGDAMPPRQIQSWLISQGEGKTLDSSIAMMPHDLYVIGTQESTLNERDWLNRLKSEISSINHYGMKKEFETVTVCSLWGIRLAVLVKPELKNSISHVKESTVKTGIANALGNKGAVGVSFYFNGTSFCFVNCHLTSGTEKCHRRNQNFHDILRGLSIGQKGLGVFDLTNQFHHMFWLGDLNYRIQWHVPDIIKHIKERSFLQLLSYEQLKREQDKGDVFVDFQEEELCFPPTYRYEIGHRKQYAYKKVKKTGIRINEPSWCDRVLWRSYPHTIIQNTSYGCSTDVVTSDHSPVFATFNVAISAPSIIPKEPCAEKSQDFKIVFHSAIATLQTTMCGSGFHLEFYSPCIDAKSTRSLKNVSCHQDSLNKSIKPSWTVDDMPKNMTPIISEPEYLVEQFILVCVRCEESDESFGEFVVSLRNKLQAEPVTFHSVLTHQGHKTGEISGTMHVQARDESLYMAFGGRRRTKTYELVAFEDSVMTPDASDSDSMSTSSGDMHSNARLRNFARGVVGGLNFFNWSAKPAEAEGTTRSPIPTPTDGTPRLIRSSDDSDMNLPSAAAASAGAARKKGSTDTTGFNMKATYEPNPVDITGFNLKPSYEPNPPFLTTPTEGDLPTLHMGEEPPPLPPPRRPVSPNPLEGRKLSPPKQISLDDLVPNKVGVHRTMSEGSTSSISDLSPSPNTYRRQLSDPPEGEPPPLPARGPVRQQFAPIREDIEDLEYPPSPPSTPPIPKRNSPKIRELRAKFEKPRGGASAEPSGDGIKPRLPQRLGERTSPDGRARPLPGEPQVDVLIDGIPPPLPAKGSQQPGVTTLDDLEDYESLRPPSTIIEWLMNLGLPQYGHELLHSGWDNVEYLDSLTEKDLQDANITNPQHRKRMLDSIRSLHIH